MSGVRVGGSSLFVVIELFVVIIVGYEMVAKFEKSSRSFVS